MTTEEAVRLVLSDMHIPGIPQRPADMITAARHAAICSACAVTVFDRVVEMLDKKDKPE